MAGVMGVDEEFRPSIPYDSWLDLRCAEQLDVIDRTLGNELIATTGCPQMVNHLPKMMWWKRRRPEAYAATAKFIMPSAYVAGRLAGLYAKDAFIDHTYLHFTGVADARAGRWSDSLISASALDRDKLPAIVPPHAVVGQVSQEAAACTGLPEGTAIAAGLGDTAASALGAGIVEPGQLLDVAGTAAVLAAGCDDFRPDVAGRSLLTMRGPIDGQWISLAYLSGGDLVTWFLSRVLARSAETPADAGSAIEEAGTAAAGSNGLLFVPFLDGRLLPSSPSMRGGWLGLERGHSHRHMLRALLESVPYEYTGYLGAISRLYPHLRPAEVRVAGGGGHSRTWDGIKASVLGLPYLRLRREEMGCWGAALVAGRAVGLFDDLAAVALRSAPIVERIEPSPRDRETYERMLPLYRSAVQSLGSTFHGLAAVQAGCGDA
jgi:xylulokinase